MAQSLVKLTLESNQYEANLRKAKKSWDDFMKGIGVSASKFTGVAAAVGAVTGALKVAKDAFFKNEQQLDEWGRKVQAAGALYDGFLISLNNADIGGFLTRMDEIVDAAKKAYNALKELDTFNAFNQINEQDLRDKYLSDLNAYRGGLIPLSQLQSSAQSYQKFLMGRQKNEQNTYEKAVFEAAKKMGVPRGNLLQVLSEYSDEQFKELLEKPLSGKKTKYLPGQFAIPITVPAPADGQEKMGQALRQLNVTELKSLQALGVQAKQTAKEINNITIELDKEVKKKGTDKKKVKPEKVELTELQKKQQEINKLEEEYIKLGNDSTDGVRKRREEIEKEIAELDKAVGLMQLLREQAHGRLLGGDIKMSGINKTPGTLLGNPDASGRDSRGNLKLQLDEKSMKTVTKNIEKSLDTQTEGTMKSVSEIGQMASGISGILSGLNQLGIDIPEGLSKVVGAIQVISSIITTISSIVTYIAARTSVPLFANGGVVHAAGGYAIPGNYMSSDKVPILANSGELILNRAQQGSLASQLMNGGMQNLNLTATISGEQIRLVLNNNSRRTGRGEYITTKFNNL